MVQAVDRKLVLAVVVVVVVARLMGTLEGKYSYTLEGMACYILEWASALAFAVPSVLAFEQAFVAVLLAIPGGIQVGMLPLDKAVDKASFVAFA